MERHGVATTQISLVREHTEKIRPPRALWVSFAFGRAFGVPDDAPFQMEVLRSALALLEVAGEPVLEDYARDVPVDAKSGVWACPVQLRTPEPATKAAGASPRRTPEARELDDWLFNETQLGATLYRLADRTGGLRGAIIPGAYARRDA